MKVGPAEENGVIVWSGGCVLSRCPIIRPGDRSRVNRLRKRNTGVIKGVYITGNSCSIRDRSVEDFLRVMVSEFLEFRDRLRKVIYQSLGILPEQIDFRGIGTE